MSNKVNRTPKAWEACPPQIDRVEMAGHYSASATSVRAFLLERLQELGEAPYISWRGILCCSLSNPQGTHALKITQRGSSVWIRGSLSKWSGCLDEYTRHYLPCDRVGAVVSEVLDRLGLSAEWVKVHSVEMGIDILVSGRVLDYTPYLRIARGQKRLHIPKEGYTHYQGSTRRVFKVYDKGKELGARTQEGTTLLRMEMTLQNGASSIGKVLGLSLPLHASELVKGDTLHFIAKLLLKMIEDILPTGIPNSTGAVKDVPIETAISLLREAYGDEGLQRLIESMEERAEAEEDKTRRKRIRDSAKELRERYSQMEAERFTKLRETIDEACNVQTEGYTEEI